MMSTTIVCEGSLEFSFSGDNTASKYDSWSFYRNQVQRCFNDAKAVDMIFLDPTSDQVWLIEVKDYRTHRRTKSINIVDEIAQKVKDTLIGLSAASFNATDYDEYKFASSVFRKNKIRVAFHLETTPSSSKLFPKALDHRSIRDALKRKIKLFDPHPRVIDCTLMMNDMNWSISYRTA